MPKDIRVYKTKILGPLTIKQMVLFIVAVVFDFMIYNLILKPMQFPPDIIVYVFILINVPILALSTDPYGIPMEKYLATIIHYNFLSPQKRKAKNRIKRKNPIQAVTAKEKKKIQKEIKKELPEHPEFQAYK